jgi:hypothetical protein
VQLQNRVQNLQLQLEQLGAKIAANPAGMSFKAVLTDLGITNSQFAQLYKEIRPQLQFYVAHPLLISEQDHLCTLPRQHACASSVAPLQSYSLKLPSMK